MGENYRLCDYMRRLLNYGAYIGWIQRLLVQVIIGQLTNYLLMYYKKAQYWHDPLAEQEYEEKSIFLADINNSGATKNESYKTNLASLNNFVLVQFTQDTIVDPRVIHYC